MHQPLGPGGATDSIMTAQASLIPELEEVIQRGSPEKCADTLQRITTLFIDGSKRFSEEHVGLFDDVLCQLVAEIETKARVELSRRLAPMVEAGTLSREAAAQLTADYAAAAERQTYLE